MGLIYLHQITKDIITNTRIRDEFLLSTNKTFIVKVIHFLFQQFPVLIAQLILLPRTMIHKLKHSQHPLLNFYLPVISGIVFLNML